MKTNSFKNLLHLTELKFIHSKIESLEENAFVNLPNLINLYMNRLLLKELPDYAFNGLSVKKLILSNNYIENMGNKTFANMNNLVNVFLNKNNLTNFNSDWFVDTPKLEVLNLNGNKLCVIRRRAFYNNKDLTEIKLSENEISVIEDDAFDGLILLKFLDLSFNYIKVMSKNVFPNRLSLTYLNLSANRLNYLSQGLLDRTSSHETHLHGNPWLCACLEQLQKKLISQNVYFQAHHLCRAVATCVVPKVSAKICLDEYDDESTDHFYRQLLPYKKELEKNKCVKFNKI